MNRDLTESPDHLPDHLPDDLANMVVGHLVELIAGRGTVTPAKVAAGAEGSARRRVLRAFLDLQNELLAREETYDEAITELQRTLENLQDQHRQLLQTQALTNELSTPIIKAGPSILMMPLIGEIDNARSTLILERLLYATKAAQARYIILDITGVPNINHSVASYFTRFAQAITLLGAQAILAGVGPDVARQLAEEGQAVSATRSVRDVEAALELCRQAESGRAGPRRMTKNA